MTNIQIIEFKVRCSNIEEQESKFKNLNPIFKGEDDQKDTYFEVVKGRLKLREGKIENALIYYNRANTADAKLSDVALYKHKADENLKRLLTQVHGVKVVVEKRRRIYFIDNVKFHFDKVENLGTFMEVEAIDEDGSIGLEKLKEQCAHYFNFFGFKESDYIDRSYSDLLLEKQINL